MDSTNQQYLAMLFDEPIFLLPEDRTVVEKDLVVETVANEESSAQSSPKPKQSDTRGVAFKGENKEKIALLVSANEYEEGSEGYQMLTKMFAALGMDIRNLLLVKGVWDIKQLISLNNHLSIDWVIDFSQCQMNLQYYIWNQGANFKLLRAHDIATISMDKLVKASLWKAVQQEFKRS